jgi:hypothetical protein
MRVQEPGIGEERRAQYEYRTSVLDIDTDLSKWGDEGWICFAIVPLEYNSKAVFHFRRNK